MVLVIINYLRLINSVLILKILGSLGTVILLLILSFDWFWNDLQRKELQFSELLVTPEFIVTFLLAVGAKFLLL